MRFTRDGYVYKYYGDEITRFWPWSYHEAKYYSTLLTRDFNSFNEYWKMVGEESALIKLSSGEGLLYGFDYEDVLCQWSSRLFVNEHIVILTDINYGAKGSEFWNRLSKKQNIHFHKDIVILKCNDYSEMERVVGFVDEEFAMAWGVLNGEILMDNTSGPRGIL